MKKSLILVGMLSIGYAHAQQGNVGINTEVPKATLEVAGQPTNANILDGIIAPRLTGDQLNAKTYTTDQTGALVYVTEAATMANQVEQTINVKKVGYYYFDGNVWQTFTGNNVISRSGLEAYSGGYKFVGSKGFFTNSIDMNILPYNRYDSYNGVGNNIILGFTNDDNYASNALVIGNNNKSIGNDDLVIGNNNTMGELLYSNNIVLGHSNKITHFNNIVLGDNNIVSDYQIVLGNNALDISKYNSTSDDDVVLFVLGNGASKNDRSNGVIVMRDNRTGIGLPKSRDYQSRNILTNEGIPTEMLDVNGNVRIRGVNASITDGNSCVNEGTISFYNGSFFGCGNGVWKKLHN